MKKLLYLFLSLSFGLAFNSCSDDDDVTLQTIMLILLERNRHRLKKLRRR